MQLYPFYIFFFLNALFSTGFSGKILETFRKNSIKSTGEISPLQLTNCFKATFPNYGLNHDLFLVVYHHLHGKDALLYITSALATSKPEELVLRMKFAKCVIEETDLRKESLLQLALLSSVADLHSKFSIEKVINTWRNHLFLFLSLKIDILEQLHKSVEYANGSAEFKHYMELIEKTVKSYEKKNIGKLLPLSKLRSKSYSKLQQNPFAPIPEKEKVIGYVTNWSQYKVSNNGLQFQNYLNRTLGSIDSTLYSHLIYSYLTLNSDNTIAMTSHDKQYLKQMIQQTKAKNPRVKVLFSLGGWTLKEVKNSKKIFSDIISQEKSRNTFINSAVSVAKEYGFDGLDLNFEYPKEIERFEIDFLDEESLPSWNIDQLISLFRRIKVEHPEFLLSIVFPSSYQINYQEMRELSFHSEFISVMTFDLTGSWKHPKESPYSLKIMIKNSSSLGHTFLRDKIVIGVPVNDKMWTSKSEIARQKVGEFRAVSAAYKELVEHEEVNKIALNDVHWTPVGEKWIVYDDENVIGAKMKFVRKMGLSGVMVWTVDQDTSNYDFTKLIIQYQRLP